MLISPKPCEIERFHRNFRPTGYLTFVLFAIFKKNFPSPKMAAILNFRIFAKNGKTQICFYLLNRASRSQGVLLEVPHFASIYKSKKQFGLSFAYDAPMIWNDLPDDVRSAKSLSSFRKKLKTYLFKKAYPP